MRQRSPILLHFDPVLPSDGNLYGLHGDYGPIDVIGRAPVGVLDADLRRAALRALAIPRNLCRDFALRFSWRRSAEEFVGNLMPIHRAPRRAYG